MICLGGVKAEEPEIDISAIKYTNDFENGEAVNVGGGLNLYTGGIVDKNGSTGNNGQILSTTTGGMDWIDSTSGETTLLSLIHI